jgi:tRNA U34 5-carboxymethylaminomethyl modifying GTPase MnmE/TrmE
LKDSLDQFFAKKSGTIGGCDKKSLDKGIKNFDHNGMEVTMKQARVAQINNPPSSTVPENTVETHDRPKKIVIIGNPNVGKSVLFNNLTNNYVTVSNYPGTSVEVTRGFADIKGERFEVIDTPGMYSLTPITEEERVGRKILIQGRPESSYMLSMLKI